MSHSGSSYNGLPHHSDGGTAGFGPPLHPGPGCSMTHNNGNQQYYENGAYLDLRRNVSQGHYPAHYAQSQSSHGVSLEQNINGHGYGYHQSNAQVPMTPVVYHAQHSQASSQSHNGDFMNSSKQVMPYPSNHVQPQSFDHRSVSSYHPHSQMNGHNINAYGQPTLANSHQFDNNNNMVLYRAPLMMTTPHQPHFNPGMSSSITSQTPSLSMSYGSVPYHNTSNSHGSAFYGWQEPPQLQQPQKINPSRLACGPPAKPKQSGYALWVGNLPPSVAIVDVKDYFSQGAKGDIQSIRLLSRTNCAFVNYSTEGACEAASRRFDDSRMLGFRISCRVRLSPDQLSAQQGLPNEPSSSLRPQADLAEMTKNFGEQRITNSPTKYFIIKSLTEQDVVASVLDGQWSTQAHNEKTLNEAFKTAEHVFLIFSINGSGEYTGYARMTSEFAEQGIEKRTIPHQEAPAPAPPIINGTQARAARCASTEYASSGRIVIDEGRDSVFWESDGIIDSNPDEVIDEVTSSPCTSRSTKIHWMCTRRTPFYKVRGLRNPWNDNQHIKVARDGTEIEPNVGKQLINILEHVD